MLVDGNKVFHCYATHGVPLYFGLMALEGKKINWREYIDSARENGWSDHRILAVMTEGLRDADWPDADKILELSKLYMLRYANG